MTTTTSNHNMRPVTPEEMRRVMAELDLRLEPPNQDWLLMAPDGRVWKGDVQTMFCVLAPHHPYLQIGGMPGTGGST